MILFSFDSCEMEAQIYNLASVMLLLTERSWNPFQLINPTSSPWTLFSQEKTMLGVLSLLLLFSCAGDGTETSPTGHCLLVEESSEGIRIIHFIVMF